MIRCVLFDRDGTLGNLFDVRYPQTFAPFCPISPIFARLKAKGYAVGIVSNQSSIARGTANNYDFNKEFSAYGAELWAICPHDDADNCNCRKPKSGLLFQICEKGGFTPDECLLVGDRLSDVQCAKNAGASAVLVLTGKGESEKEKVKALYPDLPVLSRFDEIVNFLEKL